jgi:hypothetical protein
VRPVADAFLLNIAEVSSTLIGLFLVGVFFYVESGLHRRDGAVSMSQPYLRAGTRITLIVFAIPLGMSLALVAFELVWARLLFAGLSLMLVAANVDSIIRIRGIRSIPLLVNEVITTGLAVLTVVLPWALGGFHPSREHLTLAILLAFAAGLLSIAVTVMSAFDTLRSAPSPESDPNLGERPS